RAVVDEELVGLVEDEKRVARAAPLDDPRQFRLGDHGTGRIAWRVDDDAPGPIACHGANRVERRAELNRLFRAGKDWSSARELHLIGKAHPVRRRNDHLVTLAHERQDDVEELLLAAASG